MAYIIGKVDGYGYNWLDHVTVLWVPSTYRRTNSAPKLITELFQKESKQAYFVDLFVHQSNHIAMNIR